MTKEELNKVRDLTRRICAEEIRLHNLTDWLKRITRELDGLPTEPNFQRSKIEELTTQKVDCENKLNELKAERATEQSKLLSKIDELLSDNEQKLMMAERYGFGNNFKDIAELLNKSEDHIYFIHRKAVKKITGKKSKITVR